MPVYMCSDLPSGLLIVKFDCENTIHDFTKLWNTLRAPYTSEVFEPMIVSSLPACVTPELARKLARRKVITAQFVEENEPGTVSTTVLRKEYIIAPDKDSERRYAKKEQEYYRKKAEIHNRKLREARGE